MPGYFYACTDCGCPGVERDFNRCGSCCLRKPRPAQSAALALPAPPEAVQAVPLAHQAILLASQQRLLDYETTPQDWAEFGEFCREMNQRDQDLRDARREVEYQDMLDAQL